MGRKKIEFGAYAMMYLGTHNNMKKKERTKSRIERVQ